MVQKLTDRLLSPARPLARSPLSSHLGPISRPLRNARRSAGVVPPSQLRRGFSFRVFTLRDGAGVPGCRARAPCADRGRFRWHPNGRARLRRGLVHGRRRSHGSSGAPGAGQAHPSHRHRHRQGLRANDGRVRPRERGASWLRQEHAPPGASGRTSTFSTYSRARRSAKWSWPNGSTTCSSLRADRRWQIVNVLWERKPERKA